MSWNYEISILESDTVKRFNTLDNAQYEHLVKFVMAEDNDGLSQYFNTIIQQLCISDDIIPEQINIIDKLFILTTIRSICVSPKIAINYGSKTYNVELFPFRSSIVEEYIAPIVVKDDDYNIEITVHYPKVWNHDRDLASYITSITIDNTSISIHNILPDNLQNILDQLTPRLHSKLTTAIIDIEASINRMTFCRPEKEADIITLESTELLHFLTMLYTENYNNIVELNYILIKLAGMTLTDIRTLTPVDAQLYYKMYLREQAERDKQNKAEAQKERLTIRPK